MNKICFLLFLIWLSSPAMAKQDSSLVDIADVKFSNELEKSILIKSLSDERSFFDLFFISGNHTFKQEDLSQFKKTFEYLKSEVRESGILSKKPEKQIKTIYKAIHDRYLKKYQLNTDFCNLHTSGDYNCVTATALYSLLLNDLNIPFSIKETPEHVYIIAFPGSEAILIESTDPLKGYRVFNSDYKNLFLQTLKKNKIISEAEFKTGNTDDLFNKYFFPPSEIGIKELAGIHYSNNAISLLEKELLGEAFEQLKKAYLLYPCEKNSFMLLQVNRALLENADYKNEEQVNNLVFISRFLDKGVEKDAFVGEFVKITYNFLTNDHQPERYDEIYNRLTAAIENEEVVSELKYIYNYENGRVFLTKGQFKNALPYSEKAFQLKPKNSDAQHNYIAALGQIFDNGVLDEETFERVDKLPEEYPEILQNNNFIRLQGYFYLKGIENSFKKSDDVRGLVLIKKFETVVSEHPEIKFDDNYIGRSYSEAAVFYFKKGQDGKSLGILNKGIQIAPDSKELQMRRSMIR